MTMGMEVQQYLRTIQRGWWVIVLTALAALVIALVVSYMTTPLYRATASFLISPNGATMSDRDIANSLLTLDKRSIAATYAEVLDSNQVSSDAGDALQISPAVLAQYKLSAEVLPEANVLALSASGPDPKVVASLANVAGQQAINRIETIYQVYNISLLDEAQVPTTPYSPQPVREAGIAFVLGLIVGGMLAFAREYLRGAATSTSNIDSTDAVLA